MVNRCVAPKLVTWALIIFGAAEIPWIIYLHFTQKQVVRAYHLHLATLGFGTASAAICTLTALAILSKHHSTAALAVATTTLLGFGAYVGTLTPRLQVAGPLPRDLAPLILTSPAIVAAAWTAWHVLMRERHPSPALGQMAAAVLILVALGFVFRTVQHEVIHRNSAIVDQTRAVVVMLDIGEAIGLLGAGLASLRGHVRVTLVCSVAAAVLLAADAWSNVIMVASGFAFASAVFYLIVGEVPSMVLCLFAARRADRGLREVGGSPG